MKKLLLIAFTLTISCATSIFGMEKNAGKTRSINNPTEQKASAHYEEYFEGLPKNAIYSKPFKPMPGAQNELRYNRKTNRLENIPKDYVWSITNNDYVSESSLNPFYKEPYFVVGITAAAAFVVGVVLYIKKKIDENKQIVED